MKGAKEAEAFAYSGKGTSVGIERGQISKTSRTMDQGIGVRVQVNKTLGFAYTNVPSDSRSVEDAVSKALSAAKASKPDKEWKAFPEKKLYPSITGNFDSKIAEV